MDRSNQANTATSDTLVFQVLYQSLAAALLLATLLLLGGCSKRYDSYPTYLPFDISMGENEGVGRFKSLHLVSQIDEFYRGSNVGPIGVATFVNIDDLYTTSTFGRVYSEQVMSELAMRGFDVVELRHSDVLQFLGTGGEFALSRDAAMVKQIRDLGGLVVGTYGVSPVRVYVNARLIDPSTSVVLAVGSVEMPKTTEIARLLRGGNFRASLERIPVRRFGFHSAPALDWYAHRAQLYGDMDEAPYNPNVGNLRPTLPPAQMLPRSK